MPLESASYLTDLVPSNPASSDPLSNADDHMRLIKATIKATFPNFTSAALQSTQAQIDAATLAVDTNGITLFADAGVNFKTNTTDKITNPAAGEVDVVTGGIVAARFMATSAIFPGTMTATNGFYGPGACPIGSIMIWPLDTLPSGFGVWAWCNGGTVSRATYPAYNTLMAGQVYPYGNGDGSTTVNVPNFQEVTLVGKSAMGGATSPGLLPSISASLKGLINKIFGANTYTLLRSDLPNVAPGWQVTSSNFSYISSLSTQAYLNGNNSAGTLVTGGSTASSPVVTGSVGSINGGVTQTAFNTVQPSMTTNFIIRVG